MSKNVKRSIKKLRISILTYIETNYKSQPIKLGTKIEAQGLTIHQSECGT